MSMLRNMAYLSSMLISMGICNRAARTDRSRTGHLSLEMSDSSLDPVCLTRHNNPLDPEADNRWPTVVRSTDEAAHTREGPFDYVVLCVKALPDVYDLAAVIDTVVTPQHTCILVNTTNTLGVEAAVEERFPTNVVLSLVSGAELTQLGQSEFEHKGSTEVWVGPASKNPNIPPTIQEDMSQALAMTLNTGGVNCKVSPNIRQQQYERVIGSVLSPAVGCEDEANSILGRSHFIQLVLSLRPPTMLLFWKRWAFATWCQM